MSNYEVGQTVGVKGKIKEIVENEDGLFLRLQVKTAGKTTVETFAEDQIVSDSAAPSEP